METGFSLSRYNTLCYHRTQNKLTQIGVNNETRRIIKNPLPATSRPSKRQLPLEYDLQLTYGQKNMQFSEYLKELRAAIDDWTGEKIAAESQ